MSLSSWLSWTFARSHARRAKRRHLAACPKTARLFLEQLEQRALPSVTLTGLATWLPEGPSPNTGAGNVIGSSPATTQDVGAVEAIAIDPMHPNRALAGSVNGGIWQTADITSSSPTWTTTTDDLPSLSISAVAFSPVNDSVIYAGTGSYSSDGGSFNQAGVGGGAVGVYKSSDGGATWQVLNDNGIFNGLRILRVIPTTLNHGNTVFVATTDTGIDNSGNTTGGVYRSNDGGLTWSRLSGAANGLPDAGVTDLVENPHNANQFFAAIPHSLSATNPGVYRLDLGLGNGLGNTWANVTDNMTAADLAVSLRIELAISPAVGNPVWASIIKAPQYDAKGNVTDPGGYYQRIYRGVAAGATISWAQVGPVTGSGLPQPPDIFGGNQGSLHGAILADPTDANLVYISGDTTPGNTGAHAGYIVRGDSTTNTWTALTPIAVSSGDSGTTVPNDNGDTTAPHADSRALVFANGVLLCACDGGVYQCTNPRGTARGAQTWTSLNGGGATVLVTINGKTVPESTGIQDTEFYSIAYDSQFHVIFGGTQDVGTPTQGAPGSFTYSDDSGGDGGPAAVDNFTDAGALESIRYTFGATRQVYNSALGQDPNFPKASILPQAGVSGVTGDANDAFSFSVVNAIGPTTSQLDQGQSTRVAFAAADSKTNLGVVYESNNAGSAGAVQESNGGFYVNNTWTKVLTGPGFVQASALAYGGSSASGPNPNVLYAASWNPANGLAQIFLRTTAGER